MKKKWIFPSVLVVLVGLGALAYFLVPPSLPSIERWVMSVPPGSQTLDEQRTLGSLEVVNDHPFYQMTFYGDYPRYLEAKKRFYWAMGFPKPDCSSFAVLNPQGHALLGYNNDGESRPILLLFTDPSDGYASISISAIGDGFPWFTKSFTPFDSERARSLLLYAPYDTQTGMNEMGLAVSTMTDPEGSWSLDPEKDTLGAAEARRVILDRAKDVEEAIALLSQYNVSYQGTSVSHVLLADRSGHSALLEWVDGEMKVIRNGQAWQVSTNFRVFGADETINADISQYQAGGSIPNDNLGRKYWRYVTAWETLREAGGLLSPEQSLDLLSTISVDFNNSGTRILTHYTVVYDLVTGDVRIVTDRKYQQIYYFKLSME
jgi:Acyl-coenzyme A:6-aminopenicillanic acid acyl-transferase